MRLIDADELVKSIPETHVDMFENCRNCRLLDDFQVIEIIKEALTIDPVKHGHWIIKEAVTDDGFKTKHVRCSECSHPGVSYWIACPYCGADMRKDEHNA